MYMRLCGSGAASAATASFECVVPLASCSRSGTLLVCVYYNRCHATCTKRLQCGGCERYRLEEVCACMLAELTVMRFPSRHQLGALCIGGDPKAADSVFVRMLCAPKRVRETFCLLPLRCAPHVCRPVRCAPCPRNKWPWPRARAHTHHPSSILLPAACVYIYHTKGRSTAADDSCHVQALHVAASFCVQLQGYDVVCRGQENTYA